VLKMGDLQNFTGPGVEVEFMQVKKNRLLHITHGVHGSCAEAFTLYNLRRCPFFSLGNIIGSRHSVRQVSLCRTWTASLRGKRADTCPDSE
jgi:hypothetical protein